MTALQDLLIVGAGGFARETAEAVRAINERKPLWRLLGYVDDDPGLAGRVIDGIQIVGPLKTIREYPSAALVVCVGHPGNYFSRKRIVQSLSLPESRYATIMHPSVSWPATSPIGPGSVLLASVVGTAAVTIGAHVTVMPGAIFTHDDVVEDFTTFGAGARLAGRVHVGQGAYVGSGVLVREDRRIGAWSLVGMGAVVTRDVPDGEIWMGTPARFHRRVEVPSDVLETASMP